ncbi:MAG: ATP-binding protein, partial [Sphingomonadales bacterium]
MAAPMPIGGIMPELRKPDMQAVLARTNLARHTGGFLLPILEAMSNSIHSINDRFSENNASTSGCIQVVVIDGETDDTFSVTVSDNGNGLDDDNMRAFLTPFTGRKLRKNGQGFGRFIGFKVFKRIYYSSQISGDAESNSFIFDVYADEEITPLEETLPLPFGQGCSVRYSEIRDEYIARWQELSEEQFLDRVTQNFLTYLAAGTMPQTEIAYNGKRTNLRDHFVKRFSHEEQHKFKIEFEAIEYEFTLDVSRSEYGKPYNHHTLLFFADNRILGRGRSIQNKLGRPYFERSDGTKYVVVAAVSGAFFDENANPDRTFLEAPEEQIIEIIDRACELIGDTENDQREKIRAGQSESVIALLQGHPLLRFGLDGKTVAQYVEKKPANWKTENFVADLSLQRLRAERRWSRYLKDSFADEKVFRERKDEILEQVTDTYRDALCEYVVHRRTVLEVADALRRFDSTDRMHPEDAIHDLIFPRYSDSTKTKYYRHNLWLLDERLSFVSYASSDRTLHGGRRQAGDKVIDIGFYDEVYVAGGEGTSAVMAVEFKRPGRDDYKVDTTSRDPIKQIRETIQQIRDRGSFITKQGATIEVPSSAQITAYIIADLEPSLREVAKYHDFQ